jgi:hypothetical protein
MIEQSRRHGHFDPRFHVGAASGDRPKLMLVPALSGSSRPGDGAESALQRLVLAVANRGDERELGVWENEGGGYVADVPFGGAHIDDLPSHGWIGTTSKVARFPVRRRHDMAALKAYESDRQTPASEESKLTRP